jgi:NitT/TauT family transport system substrate-binding protein
VRRRAFCLAAASAALAGRAGAQTPEHLRVVVVPTEIPISMINANAMGYFRDAGIDAEIVALANGPAGISAVLSGAADIGFGSTLPIVVAHDRGLPVTVVAGTDLHHATNPVQGIFMALATAPLHTGKDFAGKTISVPGLGSTQEYAVRTWVDATGGDSKTLRFVELPNAAVPDAIVAGRIDAGTADVLTFKSERARTLREVANVYDAIASSFITGLWYATAPWVDAHRDLTRRFIGVYERYAAWANAHPAEEVRFYAQQSGLRIDDLQGVPRAKFEPALTLDALQPVIDVAYRYGAIKRTFRASELQSSASTAAAR